MKKIKGLYLLFAILAVTASCSEEWDKHYSNKLDSMEVSPLTLYEYMKTEGDYSKFFNLLESTGVGKELGKDQYLTVWAVKNSTYSLPAENISDTLISGYHLNYLAFGATELKNELRIQCLNGIYLTVSDKEGAFYANSSKIISSKRFKNGVVHEIDGLMVPLTNMFEYVKNLGSDYSIIRDSITSYNKQVFDQKNSIPIGVDLTGNTVYDSVFYSSNPLFDKVDFSSEFKQFTLFLPSNQVIDDCFKALHAQYTLMGKSFAAADTLLAINWIKEAIFHNTKIADYGNVLDLKSPFDRIWRTTVQQINSSEKTELSNGVAYKVTKLKIPNNVIISRIKSLTHYYEYLTEAQKADLYTFKNCTAIDIVKGDETPVKGFFYYLLNVTGDITNKDEFSVEFTPLDYNATLGTVSIVKVPPGEYNLYMGFRSSAHPNVDVYMQGGAASIPLDAKPIGSDLSIKDSSPWNYDRVTETDPTISKWNGLGGLVGVVNLVGDEMTTFRIKVKFNRLGTADGLKKMQLYHWALKPTQNNY